MTMNSSQAQIEDVLKDLAEVLRKHGCTLSSPNNTLTLMLGRIVDHGEMKSHMLAAFSFITPRSAEYRARESHIAVRWSANAIGTRELEVADKKSIIEHI